MTITALYGLFGILFYRLLRNIFPEASKKYRRRIIMN
jgi:hypothetical protein